MGKFQQQLPHTDDSVRTQLKSNLLHRLYNHKLTLRDFNSDMELLQELLQFEAMHSLDVWSRASSNWRQQGDWKQPIRFNYLSLLWGLDDKGKNSSRTYKGFRTIQTSFPLDDFTLLRENVSTIHGWVVRIMTNDAASQEVVIRIGLYRTYQKWKEDPDSFSEDAVETLLTNAKNYDAALYLILSEKTGKNVGQIAIDVYLRGFNTGEYESKD